MSKSVSLTHKNIRWDKVLNRIFIFFIICFNVFFFLAVSMNTNFFVRIIIIFSFLIIGGLVFKLYHFLKKKIESKYYMRDLLLSFITNNNLFKEDFEVVQWKDGDNNIQKEKRYYVSSSAEFKYFISNSKIIVYAIKKMLISILQLKLN